MLIEQTPKWFRALFPASVIWRLPRKEKTVYLTFDDGPVPEVTPFVLNLLKKHGIKATFFCVGDNVHKHPELFEQIKNAGHQVGNHTFNHLQGFWHSTVSYVRNVEEADRCIKSPLFRPPHGQIRFFQLLKLVSKYKILMWDVITRDYNSDLNGEFVLNIVKEYTRNGSIIVFHDSLKAEKNIKYALPKAIEFLMAEGYRFDALTPQLINKRVKFPFFANRKIA
ncbi:MAG: polysaccharide deacetylase family protein [Prevotellaceae bacterium]|jgi:peptidoglycan/xylan/chitin deacetylase (PgdA/CDA1 family)|nr:polysaccharide deacetylase family protein [Prevotellaceae bacterium]